ncbi:hypothetical protein CU633_10000 [Bacillus sp. V3-13]|uniref:hypothetical protein n=1 Tax=Bacillus sp. V3-13 TaxID=2053728 RepID=UPI000C78D2EC|nr:hypothetical protein [Bacillus sp. V3-13]PLR77523.1 hypothetical protein CU633_10000 [Bacillus sp. V3-13]
MNFENFFVREKKEFDELKVMVNANFNLECKLPEQVFCQQFRYFKFEEFDWTMSGDFWNTLEKLAIETKDNFVLTAVLEPNPEEYFHKEFNYYNWVKLPVGLSADDYFEILEFGPEESPADAVLYNSNTVIWLAPSMKWAIWGERDYGVCVIGINDISYRNKLLPYLKSWRSLDETVLSWIEINFMSQQLQQDFVETLYLNYSQEK